jgi:hypothetical protein
MSETNDDKPVEVPAPEHKPNRAQRRSKGTRISMAMMRQWRANAIKSKLFTPNDKSNDSNPDSGRVDPQ